MWAHKKARVESAESLMLPESYLYTQFGVYNITIMLCICIYEQYYILITIVEE